MRVVRSDPPRSGAPPLHGSPGGVLDPLKTGSDPLVDDSGDEHVGERVTVRVTSGPVGQARQLVHRRCVPPRDQAQRKLAALHLVVVSLQRCSAWVTRCRSPGRSVPALAIEPSVSSIIWW
jgi:hypothetical protein